MATPDLEAGNPFDDPSDAMMTTSDMDSSAVLTLDRNATLTLGTDALIVLDDGMVHKREAWNCCGLLPQFSKTTSAIPFYNILWAEISDFEITVRYAQAAGKERCRVGYINYTLTDKTLYAYAQQWVDKLMDRAYPSRTQRKKRIKVLVNPFGGTGQGQKLWTREIEPIFAAAHCEVDMERTTYRGHAVEIAQKMDVDAYDVVACASGDGLPHEVFNGLAKQRHPREALRKIAVVQLPCGSGNAMSLNLNGTNSPSLAAVAIVKGIRTSLDLVAITQGQERYYSFLSQAVGIVAECDLGTESLRWMGSFRFTWGLLVRLLGKSIYPAEISMAIETDDKNLVREKFRHAVDERNATVAKQAHTSDDGSLESQSVSSETELPSLRYGTVESPLHQSFVTTDMPQLGNFYSGNMCYMSPDAPFFPASLPSEGQMDLITIPGTCPRLTSLSMLTTIENGGIMDFAEVDYRKVTGYRITPRMPPEERRQRFTSKIGRWLGGASKQKEGLISIDGERVPFAPFQAEVIPALGTVLSKRGAIYEFAGPRSQ